LTYNSAYMSSRKRRNVDTMALAIKKSINETRNEHNKSLKQRIHEYYQSLKTNVAVNRDLNWIHHPANHWYQNLDHMTKTQIMWINEHFKRKQHNIHEFIILLIAAYHWQIIGLQETVTDLEDTAVFNQIHVKLRPRQYIGTTSDYDIEVFNMNANSTIICLSLPGKDFVQEANSVGTACQILIDNGLLLRV